MASTSHTPFYSNLSLCVYIGNSTSINESILLSYCSQFGSIVTYWFPKEKFCDFHLIEFADYEQLTNFLRIPNHKLDRYTLEVKLYKHILMNHDELNLDRKFYIGPIRTQNDIHRIIEFYQKIDPTMQYFLSKQNEEDYLLLEFATRQSISRIFDRNLIPNLNEHRKLCLSKPFHPKQLVNKIISMNDKTNQIHVHGLTSKITDEILINFFHKRTPLIACYIFPKDPTCAVVEFSDEKTVRQVLDIPSIRIQGVILDLCQAPCHLASLVSSNDRNHEYSSNANLTQIMSSRPASHSALNTTSIQSVSSPVRSESGWASPPRGVINHCLPVVSPPVRSPTPSTTMKTDKHSPVDVKPVEKLPTNSLSQFIEQFQTELEQIQHDYKSKFDKDQAHIEREFNLLVDEERRTFENLRQYLKDHRRRAEKRKHTSSS
ncbi:unnamed protein product [Adineta ricciae]|uniref:RRM domain-containing protein n=1 Tax=Adineta ricciae TaxID=249248 RepID=A0A814MHS2_ADIRI|nr:unnamed protein product [Adineta ricciae]CAF1262803.1 unnamed protein product [Adineta ricciae]